MGTGRTPTSRRRGHWLIAALAVVAACADDGEAATSSTTTTSTSTSTTTADVPVVRPPALASPTPVSADALGLSATLDQYREDVAKERVRIRIENASDVVVRIETLQLAWPGLSPTPPEPVGFDIQPRMKVGLLTTYGPAVCSDPAQVTDPVPDVPIAATAETSAGPVTFPVTDPLDVLRRLYQPSCERQAIDDAVAIEFGSDWVDAGSDPPRLDGTLILTRNRPDAEVTVTGLSGSVLLLLDAEGLPATLPGGEDRMELPVSVSNGRCDGHALGESKQTYLFQLGVRVDGQDADRLLVPDVDLQERLFAAIIARCPPTLVG